MARPSLYDVLGVRPTASPAQIVTAYRRAALRTHPDAGGSESAFRLVNTAYQVLSDPERRRAYDRRLRSRAAEGCPGPTVPRQPGPPRQATGTAAPSPSRPPGPAPSPAAAPAPLSGETQRRIRHRYLAMMTCCVGLFVLAGGVVRFFSVPAALAMMSVAAVIPPVAAIIANRSRDGDR